MLVVAYYTANTPYKADAEEFRKNLDSFAIPHNIREVPNLGTWQKNTQWKSRFIQQMLQEIDGPFTYLDVDAEFQADPTLFFDGLATTTPATDLAAHKFCGHELLSGTVYFGNTPKCREVVEQWVKLCIEFPDSFPAGFLSYHPKGGRAWDQRLLCKAIESTPEVNFYDLPPEYCYIHDLSKKHYPDVKPVIMHLTASRLYKSVVNKAGLVKK